MAGVAAVTTSTPAATDERLAQLAPLPGPGDGIGGGSDGDPLPVQCDRLSPDTFVGDVVTAPAVPPFIAAARARGCRTMTGGGMFEAVRDRIVRFYLETPAS